MAETLDQTADQTAAPLGSTHPCPNCGAPLDDDDRFCNACGAAVAAPEPAEPQATRAIECKNCGAQLTVPADSLSVTCPFCDSNYVVERSPDDAQRQPPEFVIGFSVTPAQALEKFRAWLRAGGLFQPGDLHMAQIEEKLRGVYVPFWSFSMLARSRWSAKIGEYWYRTETYTTMVNGKPQIQTRQVQETEWWPLGGQHHSYYSGYLVSGSRGLPQIYADRVKPFRLVALKRYQPYFLAGWLSEQYSIERDDALTICQQEFHRQEEQNIGAFLPGDTSKSLAVETEFSDVNSDLILLPVYLLAYRYGENIFRFLVNGQTGQVAGDKPLSKWRIGGAVATALIVVVLILIWWLLVRR